MSEHPFAFGQRAGKPEAFVQWKGTDVCMDFICDCGADNHYDGYFAHVIVCGHCRKEWEMPWHLYPRPSQRDDGLTPLEPNGSRETFKQTDNADQGGRGGEWAARLQEQVERLTREPDTASGEDAPPSHREQNDG